MKRSKALLVANILATIYSIYLFCTFGVAIIKAGGIEYIKALTDYFELVFDIFGTGSTTLTIVYVIMILLCVHICVFILGCLIGWISFARKKSGSAKFAATLYLIGTICFPIFILLALPITIIGYVGAGKQKRINSNVTII